jgi:multiple sugar transport system ATP-binding protein
MSALSIDNLRVRFGAVEVLKGIDMKIDKGEFIVLVGPSGCGKSTLLNVIAGLQSSSTGRIEIGGRDVTRVAPADRDIAMVFQSYALYPAMTVKSNISFGMECRAVPRAERESAVDRVAKLLQIGHLLDRRPSQLSGGQRQRVAMGRALVRDPILFLFDEPLSNLDAKLRVEMRMEIKRLHQRVGTTMVYVTHDQIEAMTLATRIAVMHQGEIQQFAAPQTVYDEPSNLFVARFMGSPPMNTIPARIEAEGENLIAVLGHDDVRPDRLRVPRFRAGLEAWIGQDVLLGLRPEYVSLADKNGHADDENSIAHFSAQVEMLEPTGAETMALLSVAGVQAMARLAADARPAIGSCTTFAVNMSKVCLFDARTGLRIP